MTRVQRSRVGLGVAFAMLGVASTGTLALPRTALAEDERVIAGLEGAVFFPLTTPYIDDLFPGGSASVAAQFSITNYLMPLVRLRGGSLFRQPQTTSGPDYLVSITAGLRFRPRGIAHPEEPSRASCIWAEVAAGAAAWNDLVRPTFEAAIGFGFVVDDVTLGPVVRFVHVLPIDPSEGPDAFLMTVGLEVLLNDAR